MPDGEEKYRKHIYFGALLAGIIERYARVHGVTEGTIVRRLMSHVLYNEIQKVEPTYKPQERRKDWE